MPLQASNGGNLSPPATCNDSERNTLRPDPHRSQALHSQRSDQEGAAEDIHDRSSLAEHPLCRITVLGDVPSDSIIAPMRLAGYAVNARPFHAPSTPALLAAAENCDVLLTDISAQPQEVLATLKALTAAIGIGGVRPRVLCFSTVHRNPKFTTDVQRQGARYVRISDPAMLLEAIELLLWQMNDLEQHGPVFRITHRYSQGICAPGEEASAIEMYGQGDYLHLPLALTERLVFEVLARHQRIALDSWQIVSAFSGEWFFRDHAANSGHRQIKKLRRPTVKVSIERIRDAIGLAFVKAGFAFDPYDVLRSCPAAGTNRVLYKLHGRIEWHHPKNVR